MGAASGHMDRPPCCAATASCGIGYMHWETEKWEPNRGGCNAVGWCGCVQCATWTRAACRGVWAWSCGVAGAGAAGTGRHCMTWL
eukprot:8333358-Prorocentrum_lima.AAC.1